MSNADTATKFVVMTTYHQADGDRELFVGVKEYGELTDTPYLANAKFHATQEDASETARRYSMDIVDAIGGGATLEILAVELTQTFAAAITV